MKTIRRSSRSSAVRVRAVPDLQGLRRRLARANISQGMIAKQAGVRPSTISLILSGRSKSQRIVEIMRAMLANPNGVARPLGRWGKKHLEWLRAIEGKHHVLYLLGYLLL